MDERITKFKDVFAKGYKLYKKGHKCCTRSSLFIIFSALITFVVLAAFLTPGLLDSGIVLICLIAIIALDGIALLLMLIGRFKYWKGTSHMFGTAKFVMTPEAPKVAPDSFDPPLNAARTIYPNNLNNLNNLNNINR